MERNGDLSEAKAFALANKSFLSKIIKLIRKLNDSEDGGFLDYISFRSK